MPRRRSFFVSAAVLAASVAALAVFPTTPPDDPRYLQHADCPENPGPGARVPGDLEGDCDLPTGQWNLFSYWFHDAAPPGHPTGISADLAWQNNTGRDDVVVVVLDSGVNYDHADLRNQIWLNCGELPAPQDAGGSTVSAPGLYLDCLEPNTEYDLNADGSFDVLDYSDDPRIPGTITPGFMSRGDLRVWEDSVDDDGNGFVDDISGWDARDGDGDEFRTNGDGHGTGRNGFIGAQTNNATGIAGICPDCRLANVRVDGNFVTRTEGPGIGALWAAEQGHEVINMALGATTASSMTRAAFEYFTRRNGLALNATANEFSFHQNFQTVFDDVMAIGAVVPDFDFFSPPVQPPSPFPQFPDESGQTSTYLRKANFSNYGAHIDVVTPSTAPTTSGGGGYGDSSGTSSAVPHAAGVAALIYSHARDVLSFSGVTLKDISAQEVRQILNGTADDIQATDDPSGAGVYPYLPGWDRWTGYGRVNADSALASIGMSTMPPEADINTPDWYRKVGRDDPNVTIDFYANARWASTYSWTLEMGEGIEPGELGLPGHFAPIAFGVNEPSDSTLSSANLVSNHSLLWDSSGVADGRFVTLRLRVTDDLGNVAEDRMGFWIQRPDPMDHAGFPQTVAGVDGVIPTSLDSIGGALVDLNDDNKLEIILSSGDGVIYAIQQDGTPLPGWPVKTDDVGSLPLAASDAFDGDPSNGEIPISGSSVVGGVSVADIDADTVQEVCASAYNGKIYCWDATGTLEPGFPVETDKGITRDQYTGVDKLNLRGDAVLAPPALEDLDPTSDPDGPGHLELMAGAFDQKMYIWNHDGTRYKVWPLEISDSGPVNTRDPEPIISVPVAADIDADGTMELVFGTNEVYSASLPGAESGRLYAYEEDGSLELGWPVEVGPAVDANPVPLVASGVGSSPAAADIDGDGTLEIATGAFFSEPLIFNHDGSQFALMNGAAGSSGGAGRDHDEETSEGGLGKEPSFHYVALGGFADLDGTGLSYVNGALGIGIAGVAVNAGTLTLFDYHLSAWNATTGAQRPNFPRVLEDWQFFTGPAIADVDGEAVGGSPTPEILATSGGYYLHAFNGVTGVNASGFPKLLGQWVVSSPLVGDIDDDGQLEVVVPTRLGDLHVWDVESNACENPGGIPTVEWRKALHDEWGTGVYGRDTLRPARVSALTRSGPLELQFNGVGDDGRCGSSDVYEVRAVPGIVADPDWNTANFVGVEPGTPDGQQVTVSLPSTNATYLVRAFDETGNGSPVAVLPEPSRVHGLAAALALIGLLAARRRNR